MLQQLNQTKWQVGAKENKKKVQLSPNTMYVLAYGLVVVVGGGEQFLSSDWQLNKLWIYTAISPFVHVAFHKLGPYWITN